MHDTIFYNHNKTRHLFHQKRTKYVYYVNTVIWSS